MSHSKSIAIVGAGISGLAAALQLTQKHNVTVYEADSTPGGHAFTFVPDSTGRVIPIELGVIIVAERASAALFQLVRELNIQSRIVTLTFSACFSDQTSWSNHGNQKTPLWDQIMEECDRFLFDMNEVANSTNYISQNLSLGDFLVTNGYSDTFIYKGLIPLLSLIATCRSSILKTNVSTCALYFSAHRLSFFSPTLFRAFPGGTHSYISEIAHRLGSSLQLNCGVTSVERLPNGVAIIDSLGRERMYDDVVIAAQLSVAKSLIKNASAEELEVFGKYTYDQATSVLHTDQSFLASSSEKALLHYTQFGFQRSRTGTISADINFYLEQLGASRLDRQYIVTYEPGREISEEKIIYKKFWKHTHNRVDSRSLKKSLGQLQGRDRIWFCGADTSFAAHGFACASGFAVAEKLGVPYPYLDRPWVAEEREYVRTMMGLPTLE